MENSTAAVAWIAIARIQRSASRRKWAAMRKIGAVNAAGTYQSVRLRISSDPISMPSTCALGLRVVSR